MRTRDRDQNRTKPREQASAPRHRLPVQNLLPVTAGDREKRVEQALLDRARVLHADHDAGEHLLEHPRRSEVKGRADLPGIGHGGVRTLRAGQTEAGDQRLRIVEVVIADPGEREIGDRLVVLGQPVEGDRIGCRIDAADGGQHNALRLTRGTRGIEDDRGVGAPARLDLAIQPLAKRGILGERGMAVFDDVSYGVQTAVVIIAHSAWLVIDDLRELRQPFRYRHHLVDLLLVLHRGEAHVGMGQHEGELLSDRIGIDRHRDRAEHLARHDRPVQSGPIGADDGDAVATPEAETGEPDGIGARLFQHLAPGPNLPDAEILVSVGRTAAIAGGVADEELGKCIRTSGGVDRHDAALLLHRRIAGAYCSWLPLAARRKRLCVTPRL
jgi:hypothetical protein